jgi:hypothetical protein
VAAAAVVLVSGVLAGCSGAPLSGGCTPAYLPGDASNAVSVSGDVGETPAVEFPTPLIADGVERASLVAGEGEPIESGATVLLTATIFDGSSNDVVAQGTALLSANDSVLALGESLVCASAGSRLVLVGSPTELGLNVTADTAVAIIDVEQVFLGKANGVNQLPQDGLPTVVTAVDGTPGISVGYASVPDEQRTAVIKGGAGAAVAVGDSVVYHLRSWTWPATGAPTVGSDDTWARFQPTTAEITESDDPFTSALIGEKVGSQLLIVVPGTEGGAATVYVVDILGILAAD